MSKFFQNSIKRNTNWKKVEEIFTKFWVNFTLSLTTFYIKFLKFCNKFRKTEIFVNKLSYKAQYKKIKIGEITDN